MSHRRYGLLLILALALPMLAAPAVSLAVITVDLVKTPPLPAPGEFFYIDAVVTTLPVGVVTNLIIKIDYNTPDAIADFVGIESCATGVTHPADENSQKSSTATSVAYSGTTASTYEGTGCLIRFKFKVKLTATPGQTSDFTLGANTVFRDVNAVIQPHTAGTSASVHIPFIVKGVINYWQCSPTPTVRVPEVNCQIRRLAVVDDTDLSDALSGIYELRGVANAADPTILHFNRVNLAADFTLATDVKTAIDAGDVSLLNNYLACTAVASCSGDFDLEHHCVTDAAHGTAAPQVHAADVDGDGAVTGADGTALLQLLEYKLGTRLTFPPTCSTQWKFFNHPENLGTLVPPGPRVYNAIAVLRGDVNGSYVETNAPRKAISGATLAVGRVNSKEARVVIPVELKGSTSVLGLDARIVFDPAVLRFVEARPASDDSRTQVWGRALDGVMSLVVIGVGERIPATGVVALVEFERVDPTQARAATQLLVSVAEADGAAIQAEDGVFTSSAVTDASWGRVKQLFR